jgi:hypothetical protein
MALLAAALFLLLTGCAPVAPSNAINIDLSQAITLSKSNNLQNAVINSANGTMTLTASVEGSAFQIVDVNGTTAQVSNG